MVEVSKAVNYYIPWYFPNCPVRGIRSRSPSLPSSQFPRGLVAHIPILAESNADECIAKFFGHGDTFGTDEDILAFIAGLVLALSSR